MPFNDFAAHLAPIREEIDSAIRRVLDSGWYILGPEVETFERELAAQLGAREAVAVANGTEAIQLALEALGVEHGDEVVTSPFTAAFTALAIVRAGARPVFADLDPATLNVSPEALERALSSRTRALVPVHLYGHPCDMEPIWRMARKHNLHIVEDACQAHGALYKGAPVGTRSDAATLSFYPTKNLGALGDGGAVLVSDPEVGRRIRRLRNGGQERRYQHLLAGINSRLDELQAAVLRVKLGRLDAWTERRRELASLYRRLLDGAGVDLIEEQPYARAVHHLFVVRHPCRDRLAAALSRCGIETLVHYPVPLHLQPAFAFLGIQAGELPIAEKAAREVLSLPLFPELTDEQARQVADAVRDFSRNC
ncbi:MAG: DegT/DnrJ/EryC1/StrS family aminotransferase [Vicinamibacteria bacterium]|nr:DegT/DnrJ/EryC1/StrS family aminotransferase [Vicinamibacteria bacterium]